MVEIVFTVANGMILLVLRNWSDRAVVVRVSRVNDVICVETGICAFEVVNNLLILQVMESVCVQPATTDTY